MIQRWTHGDTCGEEYNCEPKKDSEGELVLYADVERLDGNYQTALAAWTAEIELRKAAERKLRKAAPAGRVLCRLWACDARPRCRPCLYRQCDTRIRRKYNCRRVEVREAGGGA